MPKSKKSKSNKSTKATKSESKVTVSRPAKDESFLNKVQADLENRNALLNVILGVLIVIIVAVLIFNYFNRARDIDTSSTQTSAETTGDVAKEDLPGNYTIKAGDTLFTIAEKYYDSGWEYIRIVEANKMTDENNISEGQVIIIPKAEDQALSASAAPATDSAVTDTVLTTAASPSLTPSDTPSVTPISSTAPVVTSGANTMTQSVWGPPITTETYTVQAGDWLSTIAARTYNGDVLAYQKIASANNIANPNLIEIGQVLKLPR